MSAFGTDSKLENLSERRELSEAAKALMADKAFGYVFRQLQERLVAQLLLEKTAGPTQDELAARLRALDVILLELGALLTDYREAAKRNLRHGS